MYAWYDNFVPKTKVLLHKYPFPSCHYYIYKHIRNQPIKGWTAATRCGVTRKQEQEGNIMKAILESPLQRTKN